MTLRTLLLTLLAAVSPMLTGCKGEESDAPPPVKLLARQLRPGARSVIVFVSAGGKEYTATAGALRPSADQRFRVGSVTKTFTAAIVLQLVDEGKLQLSSTLDDYVPGLVPRGDEISIRQLLSHRSGLVDYTDYFSWLKGASRSTATRPLDLVRFAGSKPLLFTPGSQWSYSSTNYIALGLVIEKITGHSYRHELDRRILRPLELEDTELPHTRVLPDLQDDGVMAPVAGYPTGDPIYDVDWANPTVTWAAGGIVSSAHDVSHFYSVLLSGRLLSSASLERMKATVMLRGPQPVGTGLGILSFDVRCGRSWGHGGWILDNVTLVRATEEGDRVGVISIRSSRVIPPIDESALVCPESRLSESAGESKIAFVRTTRVGPGQQRKTELYVGQADGSGERSLTLGAWPASPAWSPDGGRIAFESRRDGNSEIYVMNADGSGQQNLTHNPFSDGDLAWSPDGRMIAFIRGQGGNSGGMFVMDADGSGQRRITSNAARGNAPAWSPDGRMIAFESRRDGNSEIYVMNSDGSQQRNLTRNAFPDGDPAWSPDGRKIAFVSRSHGSRDVYVINADGSGLQSLTRDLVGSSSPVWSPDGRTIAFERRLVGAGQAAVFVLFEIWVVNADGSGRPRPLTISGRQPRWSPNGRMVAFLRTRDDNPEIYVMNADGSGQRNMTRSPSDESWFAWSPEPKN